MRARDERRVARQAKQARQAAARRSTVRAPVGWNAKAQTRAQAIALVEAARVAVCAYVPDGSERCDCKYGADNVGRCTENGSGCPELRVLGEMLTRMTDTEWARLAKRLDRAVVVSAGGTP